MARSKVKCKYLSKEVLRLVWKGRTKSSVTLHGRNSVIIPNFIGKKIFIYTGKVFKGCKITEDMVGLTVGELAFTRKTVSHSKSKK